MGRRELDWLYLCLTVISSEVLRVKSSCPAHGQRSTTGLKCDTVSHHIMVIAITSLQTEIKPAQYQYHIF